MRTHKSCFRFVVFFFSFLSPFDTTKHRDGWNRVSIEKKNKEKRQKDRINDKGGSGGDGDIGDGDNPM